MAKKYQKQKYPFWRLDTYFSELKNINIEIVENGGWHFTNVKSPQDLFIKLNNFGHHDEFELSGLTVQDIEEKINNRKFFMIILLINQIKINGIVMIY